MADMLHGGCKSRSTFCTQLTHSRHVDVTEMWPRHVVAMFKSNDTVATFLQQSGKFLYNLGCSPAIRPSHAKTKLVFLKDERGFTDVGFSFLFNAMGLIHLP